MMAPAVRCGSEQRRWRRSRTSDFTFIQRDYGVAKGKKKAMQPITTSQSHGEYRVRTGDLLRAKQALSQLS